MLLVLFVLQWHPHCLALLRLCKTLYAHIYAHANINIKGLVRESGKNVPYISRQSNSSTSTNCDSKRGCGGVLSWTYRTKGPCSSSCCCCCALASSSCSFLPSPATLLLSLSPSSFVFCLRKQTYCFHCSISCRKSRTRFVDSPRDVCKLSISCCSLRRDFSSAAAPLAAAAEDQFNCDFDFL